MPSYRLISIFIVALVFQLFTYYRSSNTLNKDCEFESMVSAILMNDLERLKKCAQNHFDLYQTNEKNENLLATARKESKEEIVNWLKAFQYIVWMNETDKNDTDHLIRAIIDTSGGIEVTRLNGSVEVSDTSGGIYINQVSEDVIVRRDGSGGLTVRNVDGEIKGVIRNVD